MFPHRETEGTVTCETERSSENGGAGMKENCKEELLPPRPPPPPPPPPLSLPIRRSAFFCDRAESESASSALLAFAFLHSLSLSLSLMCVFVLTLSPEKSAQLFLLVTPSKVREGG